MTYGPVVEVAEVQNTYRVDPSDEYILVCTYIHVGMLKLICLSVNCQWADRYLPPKEADTYHPHHLKTQTDLGCRYGQ